MISCIWKRKSTLSEEEIQLLEQSFKQYPSQSSFYPTVQTFRKAIVERNYLAFLKWLKEQLSSKNNYLFNCSLRLRSELQAIMLAFHTS